MAMEKSISKNKCVLNSFSSFMVACLCSHSIAQTFDRQHNRNGAYAAICTGGRY
jgi:hypothetical protein